jgi:hypothetical protein
MEDPWTFSQPFDYIHGRALATCFSSHLAVIKSAFAALCPGGYLELQDCVVPFCCLDASMSGTHLEKWSNMMYHAVASMGRDWGRVANYKQYLEDAGFVDVVEKKFEWPLGTWAKGTRMKMLGLWYREDLLAAMQGASLAILTKALGMDKEMGEELLVKVREDVMSNRIHAYLPV